MKIHLTNIGEDLDRLSDSIYNLREKPVEVQEHRFPTIITELQGILIYAKSVWANHLTARGENSGQVYPKDVVKGEGE